MNGIQKFVTVTFPFKFPDYAPSFLFTRKNTALRSYNLNSAHITYLNSVTTSSTLESDAIVVRISSFLVLIYNGSVCLMNKPRKKYFTVNNNEIPWLLTTCICFENYLEKKERYSWSNNFGISVSRSSMQHRHTYTNSALLEETIAMRGPVKK